MGKAERRDNFKIIWSDTCRQKTDILWIHFVVRVFLTGIAKTMAALVGVDLICRPTCVQNF